MASSNRTPKLLIYMLAILITFPTVNSTEDPSEFDRYMPTKCESCLIFANELDADVARIAPKMPRDEAEAWLLDELEQLCDRMLHYRLHKEKPGLARFSKQMSGTAKTIKDLKKRGVEVKLDVSDELLDRPSIESGKLKEHCEWILEHFEEDIEHWFMGIRHKKPISKFLCEEKFATKSEGACSDHKKKPVDEL